MITDPPSSLTETKSSRKESSFPAVMPLIKNSRVQNSRKRLSCLANMTFLNLFNYLVFFKGKKVALILPLYPSGSRSDPAVTSLASNSMRLGVKVLVLTLTLTGVSAVTSFFSTSKKQILANSNILQTL